MEAWFAKYPYPFELTDKHALELINKKMHHVSELQGAGEDYIPAFKEVHAMIEDFFEMSGLASKVLPAEEQAFLRQGTQLGYGPLFLYNEKDCPEINPDSLLLLVL